MAHKFCSNAFSLKERIYIQLFQFPYTVFTIQFHHPLYNPVIKNIYIVQSSYNILLRFTGM